MKYSFVEVPSEKYTEISYGKQYFELVTKENSLEDFPLVTNLKTSKFTYIGTTENSSLAESREVFMTKNNLDLTKSYHIFMNRVPLYQNPHRLI